MGPVVASSSKSGLGKRGREGSDDEKEEARKRKEVEELKEKDVKNVKIGKKANELQMHRRATEVGIMSWIRSGLRFLQQKHPGIVGEKNRKGWRFFTKDDFNEINTRDGMLRGYLSNLTGLAVTPKHKGGKKWIADKEYRGYWIDDRLVGTLVTSSLLCCCLIIMSTSNVFISLHYFMIGCWHWHDRDSKYLAFPGEGNPTGVKICPDNDACENYNPDPEDLEEYVENPLSLAATGKRAFFKGKTYESIVNTFSKELAGEGGELEEIKDEEEEEEEGFVPEAAGVKEGDEGVEWGKESDEEEELSEEEVAGLLAEEEKTEQQVEFQHHHARGYGGHESEYSESD